MPDPVEAETKFYLASENEIFGPHTPAEIQELLDTQVIGTDSLLWTEGMEEWVPLDQLGGDAPVADEESVAEEAAFEAADEPVLDRPKAVAPELPVVEPVAEAKPPKPFRVADNFTPEGGVAVPYDDRMGQRLAGGAGVAIFVHLLLLAFLIWSAPRLFRIVSYPPVIQPPEAPPLEVAMVSQDDATPPPETPRPIAETPPPPVAPPPPPAIPEVPLDTPPPTSQPSTFAPPTLPQPTTEAPALPTPAPSRPVPVKVRPQRSPAPIPSAAPSPSTPTNAGPSDYLDAPEPPYPRMAKQQHQEGTVILLVKINDAGNPIDVQVRRSSGHTLLDNSARDWVAQNYRFKPGDLRLLLVPVVYRITGL